MKPRIPITSAALYWLLVLCGLAGMTILRRNHMDQLAPLWAGTVLGVALGQTATLLRVRPRVPLLLAPATAWLTLPLCISFYESSGMSSGEARWFVLSFLPALAGGYLSLSERGALAAFWYPAVLWMIVILDHPLDPKRTAFHPGVAMPFLVLLGLFFVAFLRARETRRVAIWQGWGSPRLATDVQRTVLRASPVRSAASVVWTGAVGGMALLLAWWVAPQLWKKDEQLQREEMQMAWQQTKPASSPCCHGGRRQKEERIEEYLPFVNASPRATYGNNDECVPCETVAQTEHASSPYGKKTFSSDSYTYPTGAGEAPVTGGGSTGGGSGDPLASTWNNPTTPAYGYPPYTQPVAQQPGTPNVATPSTPVAVAPKKPVAPKAAPGTAKNGAAPVSAGGGGYAPYGGGYASSYQAPVVHRQRRSFTPESVPWPWLVAAAICGALGHVVLRLLRRKVTLAHLARPFWRETVDQRVSNHWQRMLIGLRDAGIQEGRDETPGAFARRIGIEGMETCATILERVRHGVRLETGDLEAMATASGRVFTAARAKAGAAGRTAALLRWPLV